MDMAKNISKPKSLERKKLLDLEMSDCRWPIGEPRHPDFYFCGAPQLDGRPYCELHWRMAFQPSRPRRQPHAAIPSTTAEAA
jgi:GcrA cell cycle regulator